MDELRILRERQQAGQEALDSARGDSPPNGSAAILAMTTTVSTYPTTAGSFFAILVQSINGSEAEGSSASYVSASSTPSYAWNAGTAIPPSGTPVVCHAVGGRWVFRYDS